MPDSTFHSSIGIRLADTCWNNRRAIMFCQFIITSVQNDLVLVIHRGRSLTVIRNQEPGSTSKVFVGVDMAQQPVLLLHVAAGLRVGVPAARQHGDKNERRPLFPGNAVRDVQRITCPVHLHGVPGLVRDAHCGLCRPRPSAILFAKLGVLIRYTSVCENSSAILRV